MIRKQYQTLTSAQRRNPPESYRVVYEIPGRSNLSEEKSTYPYGGLQVNEAFRVERQSEYTIPTISTLRAYATTNKVTAARFTVFYEPNTHNIIVKRVL